jgi:uncharacterized membrane protein (DUF2068 family)
MAESETKKHLKELAQPLNAAENRGWFVFAFGLYMLAKAATLVWIGLWLNHWIRNPSHEMANLTQVIRYVHMDPEGKWIHRLLKTLGDIDTKQMQIVSFGSFFYAFLHLVEGIGLVGRYRWGEWMVVVSTFALVPFEGYEFFMHPTWVRTSVILVNLAIGFYFIYRLRIHAEKELKLLTPVEGPAK